MFRENDYQAMRILIEEDRENILNALGLFEKKKLIYVQQKLSAESKNIIVPGKQRSELFGIPISVPKSKSKVDGRRSLRIRTKPTDEFGNDVPVKFSKVLRPVYSATKVHRVRVRKKHTRTRYGSVKGVSVGDKWNTRVECSHAGVHKPTVAGIHAGKEGAYSVAICGDYEDDQDNGYCFTYTVKLVGTGGRDLTSTSDTRRNLRTAPQCKNSTLDGANASLIRSIDTRNPVRVIRSSKLDSPFAPETGYRYDGLYTVEKYWTCVGNSGYLVCKFLMKRCGHQAPAPWYKTEPFDRIKIVKIRKKKPENRSTVLNISGKLTMNEENGDKITTCEVSQMQLQLSTTDMDDSVTIESSAVILNRDCEMRLDPSETLYQKTSVSEDDAGEKSLTDDSNKENSNKVIIKTRWRRSRLSLPSLRSDSSSSSSQSSTEATNGRQSKRRESCLDRRGLKRSSTQRGENQTPPKIAYFNISNDQSFKWSLFASQEEMKIFRKYFRKNLNYNHAADYEGEFKGFERQDSLNKVMILGFIINDIEKKQRSST